MTQNTRPAAWNTEQDDHEKLRSLMHAMMNVDAALDGAAITAVGTVVTAWRAGASAEELARLSEELAAAAAEAGARFVGPEANNHFDQQATELTESYLLEIGSHTDQGLMQYRLAATNDLWPAEDGDEAEHAATDAADNGPHGAAAGTGR